MKSPVQRAPQPMRQAVRAACERFRIEPSEDNWRALCVTVQACIDRDLATRRKDAAA